MRGAVGGNSYSRSSTHCSSSARASFGARRMGISPRADRARTDRRALGCRRRRGHCGPGRVSRAASPATGPDRFATKAIRAYGSMRATGNRMLGGQHLRARCRDAHRRSASSAAARAGVTARGFPVRPRHPSARSGTGARDRRRCGDGSNRCFDRHRRRAVDRAGVGALVSCAAAVDPGDRVRPCRSREDEANSGDRAPHLRRRGIDCTVALESRAHDGHHRHVRPACPGHHQQVAGRARPQRRDSRTRIRSGNVLAGRLRISLHVTRERAML